MKIGVLCPSDIAIRRFMPALKKIDELEFVGVAVSSAEERFGSDLPSADEIKLLLKNSNEKAQQFVSNYGGKIFSSYEEIVTSNEIEAIYIPLPPALHYKWAKKALENNKHVLVEKPATICKKHTDELVKIADGKNLVLHENYMFSFHNQLEDIERIILSGELGDVRLYRINFGFPMRSKNDFRYNRKLGGGALIDAGGYTIKYATRLLGESAKVAYSSMNYTNEFDVDLYGSGALVNDSGDVVQVAFGMDNDYKCELEIWGSKAYFTTGRVLTAPAGYEPKGTIRRNNDDFQAMMHLKSQ